VSQHTNDKQSKINTAVVCSRKNDERQLKKGWEIHCLGAYYV